MDVKQLKTKNKSIKDLFKQEPKKNEIRKKVGMYRSQDFAEACLLKLQPKPKLY